MTRKPNAAEWIISVGIAALTTVVALQVLLIDAPLLFFKVAMSAFAAWCWVGIWWYLWVQPRRHASRWPTTIGGK